MPSSKSREKILGDIRAALGSSRAPAEDFASSMEPTPDYDAGHFVDQLRKGSCEVKLVDSLGQVPAETAAYLRENGQPLTAAIAAGPLRELDWSKAGIAPVHEWSEQLTVAVTGCQGAIAETGQFIVSGAKDEAWLSLVAEIHVAVIDLAQLHSSLDDLEGLLGSEPAGLLTLIHGPSRTADIEQTIVMGAHGPRQVLALVLDSQ